MSLPGRITMLLAWALALPCLSDSITTSTYNYQIHYDDSDPSDSKHYSSASDAWAIANHFDPSSLSVTGVHKAYLNLGFLRPFGSGGADVRLEPAELTDDRANALFPGRIILPPSNLSGSGHASVDIKGLCAHELHHIVQYEYIPWGTYFLSLYPFGVEGPATAMEDSLLPEMDDPKNFTQMWGYNSGAFLGNVYDYLKDGHGEYLYGGDGYHSALFWKYLMEQYGVDRAEPGVGVDVLQRFYWLADEYRESLTTTLDRLIGERNRATTTGSGKASLHEVFQDFTIANWTRRYVNPGTYTSGYDLTVADPARFYYRDENSTTPTELFPYWYDGANWQFVTQVDENAPYAKASFAPLVPGWSTDVQHSTVGKYATEYFFCDFEPPSTDGLLLGFWAQTAASEKAWYSVIGIRESGIIDVIEKGSVNPNSGNSFSYSMVQPVDDPYKRLVAVVNGEDGGTSTYGGTSLTVSFDYYFSYSLPTIDILEPNSAYQAYVGDRTDPDRFLVKLTVTSSSYLGSGSVSGLKAGNFKVAIGRSSNVGEVLNAAYVMGEYWLTVKAPIPSFTPVGAQQLIVSLGYVADTNTAAVVYKDLKLDEVLVIDRSGSMNETSGGVDRITAARAAAQLFVDASGSDNQIGIVRFSGNLWEPDPTAYGDGEVIWPLGSMASQFERDATMLYIDEENPIGDQLSPSGSTSIGDGLYWGAKELVDRGAADAEKWIILLSDGHQNQESSFTAQKAFLLGTGTHVESIALGSGVDKNLLQSIADTTDGRYYEVAAETDTGAAESTRAAKGGVSSLGSVSSTGPGQNMVLDLADRFLLASERIHRRERVKELWGTMEPMSLTPVPVTLNEGGLTDCVVTLYTTGTSPNMQLFIRRPDGSSVPAPEAGYTADNPDSSGNFWDPSQYVTYRITNMEDGTWTFELMNPGALATDYVFVVSGKNRAGVQARLYFAQYHGIAAAYGNNGTYVHGLPMPVTVVLTDDSGPVVGAEVVATITHPDHAPIILRLRDDGGTYDGAANDGTYSAVFSATAEYSDSAGSYPEDLPPIITGSYLVTVTSSGSDNFDRDFERVNRGSFHLYDSQGLVPDKDGDLLPGRYEALYPVLDADAPDATGDPDGDGLSSISEFYIGTDPGLIDTDSGGETDGSEVANGSNPLDSSDDAIKQPLLARVLQYYSDVQPPADAIDYTPKPGQNLISVGVETNYHQMEIYRSTNSTGPFTMVATVDTVVNGGVYADIGLVNGKQYFYYVQPLSGAHRAAPSIIFSGIPRSDPVPPSGTLRINGGALFTASNRVDLTLTASSDVTHMKLSTNPDLSGVAWLTYTSSVKAFSIATPTSGTPTVIYCALRDGSDNITVVDSTITYLDSGSAGRVIGTAVASGRPDNAGISITLARSGPSIYFRTSADGAFNLPVPTGVYNISFSQEGYQTYNVTNVTVAAGSTVNIGIVMLTPVSTEPLPDLRVSSGVARIFVTENILANVVVSVTNAGPATATGVQLTGNAPLPVRILSATNSAGSCQLQGNSNVVCTVASLSSNSTFTITLTVRANFLPPEADEFTDWTDWIWFVSSHESDANLADNSLSLPVRVHAQTDWGDARGGGFPVTFEENGARHRYSPTAPWLGARWDNDGTNGNHSLNADFDDTHGAAPDDEDGVEFSGPFIPGSTATVTVICKNAPGFLDAWADFYGNTNWSDAGEQIFTGVPLAVGSNTLTFAVPVDAVPGTTTTRWRVSANGFIVYNGHAGFGEVEDHTNSIQAPLPVQVAVNLRGLLAEPDLVGRPVRYTVTVSNPGSNTATSVGLVVTHEAQAFSSIDAQSANAACQVTAGEVRCALSPLPPGAATSVSITVIPQLQGRFGISAQIVAAGDSNPADNLAEGILSALFVTAMCECDCNETIPAIDPAVTSWFTKNSGNYARAETNSGGATVTAWNKAHDSSVVGVSDNYADVQKIQYSTSEKAVYVTAEDLASYVMGPWYCKPDVGDLFDNWPAAQGMIVAIPRTLDTSDCTNTPFGSMGLWVNGTAIYNFLDGFYHSRAPAPGIDVSPGAPGSPAGTAPGPGVWNRNAYWAEKITFDPGGFHSANNEYHSHASPKLLRAQLGDNLWPIYGPIRVDGTREIQGYIEQPNAAHWQHSPILGWAFDGHPIYGPYGYSNPMDASSAIRRMRSGYVLRNGDYNTTDLTEISSEETGRTTLPLWAKLMAPTDHPELIDATDYGPRTGRTDIETFCNDIEWGLGRYVEDYAYLGHLFKDTGIPVPQVYRLGEDFDLDVHNGRCCVTPEFPQGTYAYFVTIDEDGQPAFPYITGWQYCGNLLGGEVNNVPEDATLYFSALHPNMTPPSFAGSIVLQWSSREGGEYRVLSSSDLQNWTVVSPPIPSGGATTTYTYDPGPNPPPKRFFKVTLERDGGAQP